VDNAKWGGGMTELEIPVMLGVKNGQKQKEPLADISMPETLSMPESYFLRFRQVMYDQYFPVKMKPK
jgi:hypothetical protein